MIGKLRGIIDSIDENNAVIDVGGVGYNVFCSTRTIAAFPKKGETVSLVIETHVREDHIHLYGFIDQAELAWFRELTKVSGVGTKIALAILSAHSPADISSAIAARDKAAFSSVSGIGPKLAERIVTELKGSTKLMAGAENIAKLSVVGVGKKNNVNDAMSALINLGYNRNEVYGIINKLAAENQNIDVTELIKSGLKELAR